MVELVATRLCANSGSAALVSNASLELRAGQLTVILGANGAGKTSLMRMLAGVMMPTSGTVSVKGLDLKAMSVTQRARYISYLPQSVELAWGISVYDCVSLGRFAWGGAPGRLSAGDERAVQLALQQCGLAKLQSRSCLTLSGGELARVHCARAFAADTPLLLVDEPVAALDPKHQVQTMHLIEERVKDGVSALVILHDLNLAAQFADRLIWMREGQIISDGKVEETMTQARISEVYGVQSLISGHQDRLNVVISGLDQ